MANVSRILKVLTKLRIAKSMTLIPDARPATNFIILWMVGNLVRGLRVISLRIVWCMILIPHVRSVEILFYLPIRIDAIPRIMKIKNVCFILN
jgi:hypothetical protein